MFRKSYSFLFTLEYINLEREKYIKGFKEERKEFARKRRERERELIESNVDEDASRSSGEKRADQRETS